MTVHIDETHDASLKSWVASANGHPDFPIQNLPFGIFSPAPDQVARGGVAIGDRIVDLRALAATDLLTGDALIAAEAASGATLNPLLALPAEARRALRRSLSALLTQGGSGDGSASLRDLLYEAERCRMHLPVAIGDYTDFYVGIHHARNVGKLFRPDTPLLPNYKYIPIAYHGRASSIRPSGTDVRRPQGQYQEEGAAMPGFGPTQRLDYELELGVWLAGTSELGVPVRIDQADQHIAGFCLLNDWSARDIQAWEYQPLGPFLAKNFQTTVSPWIVTAEAMAPYRIAQPARPEDDPRALPYLWDVADQRSGAYAIILEASIQSAEMRRRDLPPFRLSCGPASNMYWTVAQMVAHHTVNGCNLRAGDLLGTGTLSSADKAGYGSLLEITDGGRETLTLPSGEIRRFLEDGDEIIIAGHMTADGRATIGFGECRAMIIR